MVEDLFNKNHSPEQSVRKPNSEITATPLVAGLGLGQSQLMSLSLELTLCIFTAIIIIATSWHFSLECVILASQRFQKVASFVNTENVCYQAIKTLW